MIHPETSRPTLRLPETMASDKDCELLDRALSDLMKEDQWINDFVKRLNYTIDNIVRKK